MRVAAADTGRKAIMGSSKKNSNRARLKAEAAEQERLKSFSHKPWAEPGELSAIGIRRCWWPATLMDEIRRFRRRLNAEDSESSEIYIYYQHQLALAEKQLMSFNWDHLRGFHWRLVWRVMKWQLERLKIEDKDGENVKFKLNSRIPISLM